MTKPKRILAESKRFGGSIHVDGQSHPLRFTASTNNLHTLELTFDVLSSETAKALFRSPGKTGERVEWHAIAGSSEDGWRFFTDSFEVDDIDLAEKSLSGVAHEAFVFSPDHKSPEALHLERWIRGFHSWGGTSVETPLGAAGVQASASSEDRQLVSARAAVTTKELSDAAKWGLAAREYLNHVCAGLSFIDGGWVKFPVERFATPLGSFWRFLAVSSSPREFPPEHFLNNSEMLRALFESYFRTPPPRDRFWDAVSWMYLPTSNNEGRFLGAMTAIEFWLSLEFDRERDFTHLSEEIFSPVASILVGILDMAKLPKAMTEGAMNRILPLREFSLKQKILRAFDLKKISLEDISKTDLQDMLTRRNKLIHEGRWLDAVSWEMVYLARELVTRIVLHTIGFQGSYDSFLGGSGSHRRTFPDCKRKS